MNGRILAAALAAGFAVVAAAGPAQAGNGGTGGLAVGQNPLRLALTQCSNAGGGNVADGLRGALRAGDGQVRYVFTECLKDRLDRYSLDEIRDAIPLLGDINYGLIPPPDDVTPGLGGWLDGYIDAREAASASE